MAQPERDALTGTETTGHEWDGIRELNTPLPKWWVYVWFATIIWAIGYYVVYPSWPTMNDYVKGMWNYSSRAQHDQHMMAVKESQASWAGKFESTSVTEVYNDNTLRSYAMAGGQFLFNENCAPCHGANGQGNPGYPVLADDDWLWGGSLEAIETTIRYGIRSGHDEERANEMPAFGADELLSADQLAQMTDYVLNLAGQGGSDAGKDLFIEQCASCHGEDGKGMTDLGGPNLADGIWLFDGGKEGIMAQLNKPTHGVMPAWEGRLSNVAIKQLAIYVSTLGGGQ
ncbi:cytochrome-c oxidase, cbb3-type subunit III [Magnetospira sp. QH-2]|uniref:cytochrome-c oxidase, cbb3-type subunit III n=1 Tax=Magnetospira sp. (strain QH-2) TaxID=1288970 RepID=UPI0003E813E0|nr:cytochrome-c oxidase, cbb3-type subunit III [Magnetospira sp. QH-2]CCQ72123.1 cytochrome-c oxidase fixP chain [Magnetospira sp. QH-2]